MALPESNAQQLCIIRAGHLNDKSFNNTACIVFFSETITATETELEDCLQRSDYLHTQGGVGSSPKQFALFLELRRPNDSIRNQIHELLINPYIFIANMRCHSDPGHKTSKANCLYVV